MSGLRVMRLEETSRTARSGSSAAVSTPTAGSTGSYPTLPWRFGSTPPQSDGTCGSSSGALSGSDFIFCTTGPKTVSSSSSSGSTLAAAAPTTTSA